MTTWLSSVTKTLIAPSCLAGRSAAFATIDPFESFNVDTNGFGCPAGHAVKEQGAHSAPP